MFVESIRYIAAFILKIFYNLKIIGIENIPANGGLIFACNHLSNIDPPIIEVAIHKVRTSRFVAKRELFGVPIISYIFKKQKYIPIDRKKPGGDLKALRLSIDAIKKGDCLVVFPEGTRSRDGSPSDPKMGIGFLACKTKAPVVCARIFGTEKFPFSKNLVLAIGNMVKCNGIETRKKSKQVYLEFSNKIMSEILSIKKPHRQDIK
jgi:1-acyl-sn-glycerol-3-phosphate acyltransferase